MALLILGSPDSSLLTKIGGVPTGVAPFEWPCCQSCNGAMQFVAQIAVAETKLVDLANRDQILLVFHCQNDPGMCDDWDADGGGNAALLVDASSGGTVAPPASGETTLSAESFVSLQSYDSSVSADTEDDNYVAAVEGEQGVLGKIGGEPVWIQGDETPDCECGAKMQFVALLEEWYDGGVNFGGGGVGYAFACSTCRDKAKFLWQC